MAGETDRRRGSLLRSLLVGVLVLIAAHLSFLAGGASPGRRPLRAGEIPFQSVSGLRAYVAGLRAKGKRVPGWLEAYRYWYEQRAYPRDTVDWSAYPRAAAQRQRMPGAAFRTRGRAVARWQFVGPTNLPVPYRQYYGEGLTSGRVSGLAFSPTTPGTYFLAAGGGGVWKSTNYGQSWAPLGDQFPFTQVSSVAVHPTDGNILYVGTGDFDFWDRSTYGYGIMKSTDGGATWTQLGNSQFGQYSIRSILIDPETPSTITVTTGKNPSTYGYIWHSTNGGSTWTAVLTSFADWTEVATGALSGGNRKYYAVGNYWNGAKLYRSTDRGQTWTPLPTPFPVDGSFTEGIDVATSPTAPDTVYVLGAKDRKIYKSTTAGNSWTDITAGFPSGNASVGTNYNWSQYWYDYHITCSTNPNTGQDMVYVGLIDLAASPDGGATWQSVGRTYDTDARTHNDQHCMTVNPSNPNEMLVGNDGGVYRLTYTPATGTWAFDTNLSGMLGITHFYRADFHPTDPTRMLAGSQDNATPTAVGDLQYWLNKGGGDGGFCAINKFNTNIQYTTAQNLWIYRTTDQWATSIVLRTSWGNDRVPFIAPITLDPSSPNLLYAGTNYLNRYNQNTNAWSDHLGGQELTTGTLSYIAVAPSDGNRIYTGGSDGQVWMTTDGGTTWTRIDTGTTSLPPRTITSIAVHPTDPNSVLVSVSGTGSGHVWRCSGTQAGAARTWANVSGSGVTGLPDIPHGCVRYDPTSTSTYYTANDVGVFYTTDGSTTWSNATAPLGLPNVAVSDLSVVPGTGFLMAATWGRGLWRIARPVGQDTPTISGTVLYDNLPLRSVTISAGTFSTTTGADGTYALSGLEPGNYAVTASKPGYTFTPSLREVTVGPDQTGVDFAATTSTADAYEPDNLPGDAKPILFGQTQSRSIHVSGDIDWVRFTVATTSDVTLMTNGASGDTEMWLYGPNSTSALVAYNDNGNGSFSRIIRTGTGALAPGTYYVKVQSYANWASISAYTLSLTGGLSISGTVTSGGAGLSGVVVTAGGASATTAADGTYTLASLAAGNYQVRPSKTGYRFTPRQELVKASAASVTGVNFTGVGIYSISGSVTLGGSGLAGVTVQAGNRSARTGNNGSYTISNLEPATYTVVPSAAGTSFTPFFRLVTVGPDASGVNFTAAVGGQAPATPRGKPAAGARGGGVVR